MKILITICGRGGSKGVPLKNVKLLNGKPLIAYSIDHAQKFADRMGNTDIVLSTDDEVIKMVAAEYGLASSYLRPKSLATDSVGKIEVLRHVLFDQENHYAHTYDLILDLDITSPLRTIEDLEKACLKLLEVKDAYNIFSVSKPHRNPYFNMVQPQSDGYCRLVINGGNLTRQSAPTVYDMNASFYFYRRAFFKDNLNSAITSKSLFYLMEHECFDLDEPLDFEIMEFLLKERKINIQI